MYVLLNMEKSTKLWVGIVIAVVIIFGAYKAFGDTVSGPGPYDEFAQCLTDAGAEFYGAYWCPHCANQKALFGSSIKYVNYIECDPRGDHAQPALCEEKGITGFPTWIFADGSRASGERPLAELAFKTGCELPQ